MLLLRPSTTLFPYTTLFRSGSWKGLYGAEGYMLSADTIKVPTYAQAALGGTGYSTWVWSNSTTDVRALQKATGTGARQAATRSEEHTSELQSLRHLVCRLLL